MAIVHAVTDNDPENADARLRALKKDPEKLAAVAMLINGKGETKHQPAGTITVPDLPAAALLTVAKEKAGFKDINSGYNKYGFVRGECGKTYEVAKWAPGRGVSSDAVREHFSALGFEGNAVAFVAWIAKVNRDGWYATIPEDDKCFVDGGVLRAPSFLRDGSCRGLGLPRLAGDWHGDRVFVAFREIPQK